MRPLSAVLYVTAVTMMVVGWHADASAASVVPTRMPGNPTCSSATNLDIVTEFKVDPAQSGTFPAGGVEFIPGSIPQDGVEIEVDLDEEGQLSEWTSNIAVLCVVVKGGPADAPANIYNYGPTGAFGDTELTTAPFVNPRGVTITPEIGHFTFAFGLIESEPEPSQTIGFAACPLTPQELAMVCEAFNSGPGGGKAVIYGFNAEDPQWAFEDENGVIGPSQCACNVTPVDCDPNVIDLTEGGPENNACVSVDRPAIAPSVILELLFGGDPCVTIGGERVCNSIP